jgi:hypothetical protein
MSSGERTFIRNGRIVTESGNLINIDFFAHPQPTINEVRESKLDESLWLNPEGAAAEAVSFIQEQGRELTPLSHRLAMKAITVPYFERQFQGEEVSQDVLENVNGVRQQNSELLDLYLSYLEDETIDQHVLRQAIIDSSTLQLAARSLRGDKKDDIILLPAQRDQETPLSALTFTVIRQASLGRALLAVTDDARITQANRTQPDRPQIIIKPRDLIVQRSTINDLANALVQEQENHSELTREQYLEIEFAAAHLYSKIEDHFDKTQG